VLAGLRSLSQVFVTARILVKSLVRHACRRKLALSPDTPPSIPRLSGFCNISAPCQYAYVRGDVHVNTVEGYFSVFKRGMIGTYQHVSGHHLHRYVSEFDFRQNTRVKLGFDDEMRAVEAIKAAKGKRLTYKPLKTGRSESLA
jgi:hypothetical protein